MFPCAHLCYSEFASKVSKAIEALPDNSNISSSSYFLREAFQFIEKILLLTEPYATNVIAVRFLEHLPEKNKENWLKILQPKTKTVYKELEDHLDKIFSRKIPNR